MKKAFITVSICSCFLLACNNSSDSANSAAEVSADTSLQNEAPSGSVIPVEAPSAINAQPLTDPSAQPLVQTVTGQPATAPGMNPPHGQPGHNCDIAVGAPLNSAPAAKTAAKVEPGNTTLTPISTPVGSQISIPSPAPGISTPTKTAPGMNPPHGEPGHDCAIAVGAPLKK